MFKDRGASLDWGGRMVSFQGREERAGQQQ